MEASGLAQPAHDLAGDSIGRDLLPRTVTSRNRRRITAMAGTTIAPASSGR